MIRAAIVDSHRKHIISNVLERHNVRIDLKCSLIPKQSLFGGEGEGANPQLCQKVLQVTLTACANAWSTTQSRLKVMEKVSL